MLGGWRGVNLGDVKEVVIDPRTGKVAYAVVSFGGFLSMGEKLFAIPFSAFEYNVAKNEYMLDISKERLEAAPGFDADHWHSASPRMTVSGVRRSCDVDEESSLGTARLRENKKLNQLATRIL